VKSYKIAVIEGDGIGREVVPEGIRVLEAAGRRFDLSLSWQHFDWSCETYLKTGRMKMVSSSYVRTTPSIWGP